MFQEAGVALAASQSEAFRGGRDPASEGIRGSCVSAPASPKCRRPRSTAARRGDPGAAVARNGSVLYAGPKPLREYFDSLVSPWLAAGRSYEMPFLAGLMPHSMASPEVLVLHPPAGTGDKDKHLRVREQFLPVRTCVCASACRKGNPCARSLCRAPAGRSPSSRARAGWISRSRRGVSTKPSGPISNHNDYDN
jgi:hypothetical protein